MRASVDEACDLAPAPLVLDVVKALRVQLALAEVAGLVEPFLVLRDFVLQR